MKKRTKNYNDDYTSSFYLMNMVKDLDLVMDTACRNGLTLPLTAAAQAVYKASDSFDQ